MRISFVCRGRTKKLKALFRPGFYRISDITSFQAILVKGVIASEAPTTSPCVFERRLFFEY